MTREEFDRAFDDLRSEYRTPVQDKEEFWTLLTQVRSIKAKNILEIGAEKGGTLWFWGHIVVPGGRVVGIDLQDRTIVSDLKAQVVVGDSTRQETFDFVSPMFPEGLDFLFIDGSHQYEDVKSDYDMYSKLVRPGGLIALHDIRGEGVPRAWAEIKAQHSRHEESVHTIGTGWVWK